MRFDIHPPGRQFAMTFVDDTDLSTCENTRPVYELLAEKRFWGTKTVWPLRARRNSAFRRVDERPSADTGTGATLEDDDYRDFIRWVQHSGFEIALHGAAAGNSTREEIVLGLRRFRDVIGTPPTMNAFHQTNLDNLYCGHHKLDAVPLRLLERITDRSDYEGHREGTPSFWGDIAYDTFRYVRLPFHTIDDINTLRVNPSMPFADRRRPYVRRWFAASDGADVLRFNRLLSTSNVDRLARQRGVCIIYTHFAKGFARSGTGGYVLDDAFVRTVSQVAKHPGAWFATATQVLDRLATIRSLSLRQVGREMSIKNNSDRAIENVVLRLSQPMTLRLRDGERLASSAGEVVLPRLEALQEILILTDTAGTRTIAARPAEIDRRERRAIEYRNYLGLLRGWYRDRRHWRRHATAPSGPRIV